MTLPIFGSLVSFLLQAGPQAGEVAIRMGNEETRLSLVREAPEVMYINCSGKCTTVQLKVIAPQVVFYALQLQETWFAFPAGRSFDFEVLRPCVGSGLERLPNTHE